MNRVDLHLHSTASDGKFSPEEIVARAAAIGLTCIALTDHDTVDGIAPALEAAKAYSQLKLIPGVEISTENPGGEAHVLGYFIDYQSQELEAELERFRNSRLRRAQRMVGRLSEMGIHVEWPRVREIAGDGSVGRPHIAQAMLEQGYIKSIKDAFTGYIEHGGPAYVERDKMTPAEAVQLVIKAKGLPVLAHPFTLKNPEELIAQLKAAGLAGIETYYKAYTGEEIAKLAGLAEKYGLITTGGTDFHGLENNDEVEMGSVAVPSEAVERLVNLSGH